VGTTAEMQINKKINNIEAKPYAVVAARNLGLTFATNDGPVHAATRSASGFSATNIHSSPG